MPGEFDFISWLREQRSRSPFTRLGIGDDLAILKLPADDLLLVGVDQMMDGVHFDSAIHDPRAIGRKAMNRNLSDCAAMACLPFAAVATFCLPKGVGVDYARELYLGMTDAGAPFECPVVGGDTGSWPGKLVISVTILGRSAGIEPVKRSGARPGDRIYVTGPLGGSILGRHMTFEPRVKLARYLAGTGQITSMIDLSDGLSRDLVHICRDSDMSADVFESMVPIHPDAVELSRDGRSPLDHALDDGEDYELVFTASKSLFEAGNLDQDLIAGITEIGYIAGGFGIQLVHPDRTVTVIETKAWEHSL